MIYIEILILVILVISKRIVIQFQERSRNCQEQRFIARKRSSRPEKFPSNVDYAQWRQKLKEIGIDACNWGKSEKGRWMLKICWENQCTI